ncbi:MAG: hypothetical protein IIC20_05680 [Chloroflexi bacterium]|nr:hypothetical protein [Chloroflexota bacterium]
MTARPSLASEAFDVADSLEAVDDHLYAKGLTDGLPVVPPTEERVWSMIAATGLAPDHLVAEVGPTAGEATVEKLAINAVMAGCRPEHMPVLIAAVEAMTQEQFNLAGVQGTTNPCGVALVLNGPVRKLLDVNCGRNCLGPGRRANAVLGRAVRLVLLNIGGGRPGEVDKATHGFPGKFTLCFGEDEENSPWAPLHVDRGFKPEQSAVTVVSVNSTLNILTASFLHLRDMLLAMADALSVRATNNALLGKGEPIMLVSPGHAQAASKEGMSKLDVQRFLYDHCGFPETDLPQEMVRRERIGAVTREGIVRPVRRAEDIFVVVAGGPEPYHATFMPTFGDSLAVTQEVRLPG